MSTSTRPAVPTSEPASSAETPAWLTLVAEKTRSLQYGTIQITVHDSQVVQVERTERHRFDTSRPR